MKFGGSLRRRKEKYGTIKKIDENIKEINENMKEINENIKKINEIPKRSLNMYEISKALKKFKSARDSAINT